MGNMVDGVWHAEGLFKSDEKGGFQRPDSGFRDWVTADGEPGPDGQTGHRAEGGRYHLYVSYACPWAHRTMIVRALKGLESMIDLSVVDPLMRDDGWTFATERGGTGDPLHGSDYLWQLYARAREGYTGKVTVPVLWDTARDTIVSNESAEIIRMFNSAFDGLGALDGDYYPADLRHEIDAVNATVYDRVNNGVYKCGFAKTQAAYDEAVAPLFAELDRLDERLTGREWLVGDRMTEADIRLFTSLVRFDAVYHGHFKCNVRRVQDYPALEGLLERMLAIPAIADTVHLDHIKTHYYASHLELNPTGIVPAGPDLPWAGLVRPSYS